jgi:hypothetical protein
MRDPKRIPHVLAIVRTAWEKYPEMRLSQLINNLSASKDAYYLEDDALAAKLASTYGVPEPRCTCGNNFANPEPYCAIHLGDGVVNLMAAVERALRPPVRQESTRTFEVLQAFLDSWMTSEDACLVCGPFESNLRHDPDKQCPIFALEQLLLTLTRKS